MMKRKFSGISLKEAMRLIPTEEFVAWKIPSEARSPGESLQKHLQRLEFSDLSASEAAKTLLIDALLVEIIPRHVRLKVWKSAPLETDTLTGIADYLVAPLRAYLKTPLLCASEAKTR